MPKTTTLTRENSAISAEVRRRATLSTANQSVTATVEEKQIIGPTTANQWRLAEWASRRLGGAKESLAGNAVN